MLDTRSMAAEYRLAHWAGILRDRQESGLTVNAFCKSAGFHPNSYFYWQRKLRKAAHNELANKIPCGDIVQNGWALCETDEVINNEKSLSIEIGPCRILATQDVDATLLLKVCRVLVQL
jgi:putative transposase